MTGHDILLYLSLKYQGDWEKIYEAIKRRETFDYEAAQEEIAKVKSPVLTITDSGYPRILRHVYRPPFVLYYYGDITLLNDEKRRLAIIGSRAASKYGLQVTESFSKELASNLVIVSGLARGIDTAALKSAIQAGGRVIAILGSGIEKCYPQENLEIFTEIKNNHLLLSEYPLDTPPDSVHFPFRNRLIAAMSDAVLVAEAKQRSGTLITIGYALALGRDIFCIPHRVGESPGTNCLIRDGATLAETPKDLRDYYQDFVRKVSDDE